MPALRDQRQRAREVGLDQALPGLPRLALVEEDGGAWPVLAELVGGVGEHVGIALVEHEAVAREPDRIGHQRCPRARPEPGPRQLQPGNRARDPDREIAAAAAFRHRIAVGVLVHGRGGRAGRGLAEIDERGAPVVEADGHEPAAAEIAGLGEGDRERIADRDRGIDGIAAALQHIDPGLRREPVGADDHAVLRPDRSPRGGLTRRRPGQRQRGRAGQDQAQSLADHHYPREM